MNHWHLGDREHMPKFVDKFRQLMVDGQGVEVSIRPGASDFYEDRFSYYWLITGWSVFVFNVMAMVVVIVHMSSGALSYAWLPHLAGTAIIDAGIAFMAVIYRFVLFPAPLYHSRSLPMEDMPAYGAMFGRGAPQPSPAPFTPPRGQQVGGAPAEAAPNGSKGTSTK
jgi:hypothetical protein